MVSSPMTKQCKTSFLSYKYHQGLLFLNSPPSCSRQWKARDGDPKASKGFFHSATQLTSIINAEGHKNTRLKLDVLYWHVQNYPSGFLIKEYSSSSFWAMSEQERGKEGSVHPCFHQPFFYIKLSLLCLPPPVFQILYTLLMIMVFMLLLSQGHKVPSTYWMPPLCPTTFPGSQGGQAPRPHHEWGGSHGEGQGMWCHPPKCGTLGHLLPQGHHLFALLFISSHSSSKKIFIQDFPAAAQGICKITMSTRTSILHLKNSVFLTQNTQ